MYIDIPKPATKYISVIIEKRMTLLKNRILKQHKDDWYDYEGSQLEMKICHASDEYCRLNSVINEFYKSNL